MRAPCVLMLLSGVCSTADTVPANDPRLVWTGRRIGATPAPSPPPPPSPSPVACTTWSAPMPGYIAAHSVGPALRGVTLQECQKQCDAHPTCHSVDFNPSVGTDDKSPVYVPSERELWGAWQPESYCNLRDCSAGDGACALDTSDVKWHSYTCEQRNSSTAIAEVTPAAAAAAVVEYD